MAFPPSPSIQIFKNRVKMETGRLAPHASETKLQQLMRWISSVLPTALQVFKPQCMWWKGQCVSAASAMAVRAEPIHQPCQKPCTHRSQSQGHTPLLGRGKETTFNLCRVSGHRNAAQTFSPISLDLNHSARLLLSSSATQVTNRATRGCYNIHGPQIPCPGI